MVRQHVDPFQSRYQELIEIPNWNEIFENSNLPILIDIGPARGKYLIEMAEKNLDRNYLGLEIREQLVTKANEEVKEKKLRNIHFIFCNASLNFIPIYESLKNRVDIVNILNPDPWYKNSHKKRRLITLDFVKGLYYNVKNGLEIHIQSDVEELIKDIDQTMEFFFEKIGDDFPVISDREKYALANDETIFKRIFRKKIR
ncbi:Putative methyltransferase [seawater metagenome]|uniref:tRNA (guanine(46)-N(7))-methyltransferase n=1 Tax=seawater metagenome TaxID=1561972 RepID=A0A5E8CIS5_9ZZZZ